MSTYLVTGAAGFIASKVCEFLLADGHTVIGVDNLNDYYDVRLKDYRMGRLLSLAPNIAGLSYGNVTLLEAERLFKPIGDSSTVSVYYSLLTLERAGVTQGKFTFRLLDIENMSELESLFREYRFDAVFNLAGRAGVRYSLENPHVYLSTNTLGTLNVLECQKKYSVKKHILASSSSLYAGCPIPFEEDQPVNTPQSPYAATKKAAELMAYTYYKVYGLDISVLRYFTVYGPAGRPDMAPLRFIKWIAEGIPLTLYGDGTQKRDFTYIDDIARGTVSAAACSGYNIINLGGGSLFELNDVISLIESKLGKKSRVVRMPNNSADVEKTQANNTRALRLLGWKPTMSVDGGFTRFVDWYNLNKGLVEKIAV